MTGPGSSHLDQSDQGRLHTRRSDLVAARLSLEAALPSQLVDDHAAGASLAIVIEVPSAAWCAPIGTVLTNQFDHVSGAGRLRIISGSTKQTPADVDTVVSGLGDGRTIVGISPDPRRCLPPALIHAADAWITIPHVKGDVLAAILAEATGEVVALNALGGLDGFDLSEIATAMRRGSSPDACLARLRAIQARRAVVVDDSTLPLDRMHGYGAAADWGLALARDIDRLRKEDAGITLADLPRGILCYGPPGVGKTLFAKSLAKSCGVPLTVSSASVWLSAGDGHLDDALKAARAAVESARASYLSLVPRQHSTGGKPRLGSISKMGNRHLRKLLVVGAHAALYSMKSGKTRTALADWARSLLAKKPFKVVAVALANKMAGSPGR
jgi:hypothetical protein